MVEVKDLRVAERISKLNDNEPIYGEYKRGNSWVHCHNAFVTCATQSYDKIDFDSLALHLAFYLASWGMYRGSSFLLNMDYKIHIQPVKMMMEAQYQKLFDIGNPFADSAKAENYKTLLFEKETGIYCRLEEHYKRAHSAFAEDKKIEYESDTLLTKILLGVYGCIPAYDRFFKRGLSLFGRQQWLKNDGNALFKKSKSLGELLQEGILQKELEQYYNAHPEYTFMKVVDMYFFSLGAYFEEGYDKLSLDEKKAKAEVFKEKIEKEYR